MGALESPWLWEVSAGRTHWLPLPICPLVKRCRLEAEACRRSTGEAKTPGETVVASGPERRQLVSTWVGAG